MLFVYVFSLCNWKKPIDLFTSRFIQNIMLTKTLFALNFYLTASYDFELNVKVIWTTENCPYLLHCFVKNFT